MPQMDQMRGEQHEPMHEPMSDEELQEVRDWCKDLGVGVDGFYIEVRLVAHLLAEVDWLRAENAALRDREARERKRIEEARDREQQPSLFPELDIRGEGDNE